MKKFSKLSLLTVSLFMATQALGTSSAFADSVKERGEAMKSVGGSMKVLAGMFKGANEFVGEDAEKHGKNIIAMFAKAQPLFNDGKESENSRAKATIWSDAAGFEAAFKKGAAGAAAVAAAGAEFDEDVFKAAFKQLAGGCKGCHETYRLPKKE